MYRIVALILALGYLCTTKGIAQTNPPYLYQVGVADSLHSNTLPEERKIWVHLPESYTPGSMEKYPVVYILDGGVQLKALETVYNAYRGHHLPDMILVGISNRTNRTRDLTTSRITHRNGGVINEETGGADRFIEFISEELIPFVDSKFPTTPYRTLIGHSYAGLFTVYTLINHPELFENYIAIDPSLDWDDQRLLREARKILVNQNFDGKSLYVSMSAGQLHLLNGQITLQNVMQDTSDYTLFSRSIIEFSEFAEDQLQNGLRFSWKQYPDDYHWTVPLPSIRDGLIAQFQWYQLESPTQYNNPDTPLKELLKLVEKRKQILNEHFGYAVPPLVEELCNQMGYMSLQFGQPEKSFAFFKMGVEFYPESANSYDSMADYYESINDYANALKNVTRAFELSGSDYYKNRMAQLKGRK